MLIQLTVIMSIPAGAIDEVQIEGHFHKFHTVLHQSPSQQATLPEFTAIGRSEIRGFLLQIKH